jgi:RND superfamily putative drug exporter
VVSERREQGNAALKRRSWSTLIAWGAAIVLLTFLGRGIVDRLTPLSLEVPGTPSSRAEAMLRAKFGNTIPIAILLKGSPALLDSQGQRLVSELRGLRPVQVLSPFQPSMSMGAATERSLRPEPGVAFVLVNYIRPTSGAMAVVPETEAILARTVHPPVHSYLTGVAVIGHALQEATMSDTERAEIIALPALILVLLLVFRSPVAAAVPLAMGAATVLAGHGLLWLASFVTPINSLGVAIAAMMSLALGVDYALLMVSRVRQELACDWDYEAAVAIASRAAGRTIVAAGGTLALTMLAASAVATPGLLGPVAIGVVISGLLSVALALTAMPALLRLLGPSLNRWEIRLPRSRRGGRRDSIGALAERMIAHPAITVPLILAGMLLLSAPAGALRLGPPDAAELPASSPARHAVEMVERTIGPGWSAPFVIVASARDGPITAPARLRALMRWQEEIARAPGVAAVLGPASVAGARVELAQAHAALASAPRRLEGAQHGVHGLRSGLSRASDGVGELRDGLASAANGARSLGGGAGRAESGARLLAGETGRARTGAGRLADETGRAQAGARRLASGTGRAHAGAERLAAETGKAGRGARRLQGGLGRAAAGATALAGGIDEASAGAERLATGDRPLTTGAAQLAQAMDGIDERVHAILAQVERVTPIPRQASPLIAGLDRLRAGADAVAAGTRESEEGAIALHSGLQRLAAGGHTLSGGLTGLQGGADQLAEGLGKLANGDGRLASGLGKLTRANKRLAGGLGKLTDGNVQLASGLGKLAAGNGRLAGGLGALVAGNARLASGLSAGDSQAGALAAGLGRAQGPLRSYATMLHGYQRDYRLLHADTPNAPDSGYLVLTALDGTASPMREQVAQLVNVDAGGQAARIMVVASSPPGAPATAALSSRLRNSLPALAAATGGKVEVGQGAQYLLDYKNANTARVPWLVLALAIVAMLTLVVVLRALLLPLIAVALNLATIAVALGALELLTREHVLGGPGYIDAASGAGILSIMFVLSIDYEVFLLTRMREQFLATSDSEGSIRYGLRHTAGVITGSAAIMTAVFLAFAGADVIPLRQFGVGLTIAVLFDATIVRLVLLPSIMRVLGPRIWWLPSWLDRRLPNIERMPSELSIPRGEIR